MNLKPLALAFLAAPLAAPLQAQINKAPDITKVPTLYVVPYAHLDTQWRWEMPQTISEYLLKTMRVNFDYIDRYPHYVFNWTGSNRYRLMKEYYPDDYARLTRYIAAGRWFPAGSSVEEGDVNLPSAEAILRQVLYGNDYYRQDFGKASTEYMIPDCFGFPASLPAILAHAGIKGFSTQKLSASWQPAPKVGGPDSPEHTPEGIPFNVGVWRGPDGSQVVAALNPGDYGSNVYSDLSSPKVPSAPLATPAEIAAFTPQQQRTVARLQEDSEPDWTKRIALDGQVTGVFADYHYVGTGDIGGATEESSVKLLEAIATQSETVLPQHPRPAFLHPATASPEPVRVGTGPVHVIETEADQLFNDLTPAMTARMPTWTGDLELINHSAGSLTSQAWHKRQVVRNEGLAQAAEESSVAAALLGGRMYPQQRMNDAWTLALGGHFHDTAAGTATPRAYTYAWNDDTLVSNQFAGILTSATEAVASTLDTRGLGTPVVIFNAINIDRDDLVTAAIPGASSVRVIGPSGPVPAQVSDGKVTFSAHVPSVGFAVYNVSPAPPTATLSQLQVTANSLENARYKVLLNSDGDVASIFDKQLQKELLAAPIRLALSNDTPKQWPAWNMDFYQEQAAPVAYVGGPAQIRIAESGPVRIALEVTRRALGSTFTQTISLAAGDPGNRVEFSNRIDWRGQAVNLKATFPLTASNLNATYNEDIGTVQRPNAFDRQFETMSHRWIDLTDKSGAFGVTILTEAKNASDKPTDNTLRLTLLRTPGVRPAANGGPGGYSDQATQDWGHHEFTFALAGHAAGWREAQTDWQAYRLNDPLRAFTTTAHPGPLGKSFSLVHISNPRIRVLALKKAENSDETIVRLVELDGKPAPGVRINFASPIASAREVNGQEQNPEQALGTIPVQAGTLITSFNGYQPKTFALHLGKAPTVATPVSSQPVIFQAGQYDLAAASNDDTPTGGPGMSDGLAYPAEMLPLTLSYAGIDFHLAPAGTGKNNAITAHGQSIPLPAGYNRVYLLAASSSGDRQAEFRVGNQPTTVTVQDWSGFLGQWDTRVWNSPAPRDWATSAHHQPFPGDFKQRENPDSTPRSTDYAGLLPGYTKPADVAWYSSHHHTAAGLNEPYQYSYLFAYAFDLPPGAATLTLPSDPAIRIFAVTVAQENPTVTPAQPLHDTLARTAPTSTLEPAP